MARNNCVVFAYIDDILCVGSDMKDCNHCYDTLVELVQSLGLVINWRKGSEPTTKLTYLGVVIDCQNPILSLPMDTLFELNILISIGRETKMQPSWIYRNC